MAHIRNGVTRGCRHKFVNPIEGKEGQFKCAWCYKKFASSTELKQEYERLKVPYKIRDPQAPESLRRNVLTSSYVKAQTRRNPIY